MLNALNRQVLGKDLNGNVTYLWPPALATQSVILSANTAALITVPKGYNSAFFSYTVGANVWMNCNQEAIGVPPDSGGDFLSTGDDDYLVTGDGDYLVTSLDNLLELNVAGWQVNPGDVLRFISNAPATVQISFRNI